MSSSTCIHGDLETYGQIVLFGDSITEQSFNPEFYGHGSALANTYTRKCDIINRGFSGYTTVQALALLNRIFPERDDNVLLVVVFFGANDAVLPGGQQHVPLEQYIANCETLLTSPALRGKVIAVTPPPIEEYSHESDFGRTRTVASTHEYGKALRDLCLRHEIACADVWSAMMAKLDWKDNDGAATALPGSLELPKNERLASFFRDGLHPVGSGYRIIYDTIYSQICTHFPHLAADKIEPHTPYWSHATAPKKGEVVRWRIVTHSWTEETYGALLALVADTDCEKISKFHFAKDRRMALASILLQRRFITQVLGYPIEKHQGIPRDEQNRPYFRHKAVRQHDFNVSHHAGTVVLTGVLEAGRIGVDVTVAEVLKDNEAADEYLSSFKDSFSTLEWGQISNDLQRFAQHWALKEAYTKFQGSGIIVDLQEIEFRDVKYVNERNVLQRFAGSLYLKGQRQDLYFELHYVDKTYVAIATRDEQAMGGFSTLADKDLLES